MEIISLFQNCESTRKSCLSKGSSVSSNTLTKKQLAYRKEVLEWLFGLSLEDRMKVCLVKDEWRTKIVYSMFYKLDSTKQAKFAKSCKEKTHYTVYAGQYNDSLFNCHSFFRFEESLSEHPIERQKQERQAEFASFLSFLILNDKNAVGLKKELLSNKELFTEIFSLYSDKQFLSEEIRKGEIPKWFEEKVNFFAPELVIALIEENITKLYHSGSNKHLFEENTDLFTKRKNLVPFLEENYCEKPEKLLEELNLNQILTETVENKELKQKITEMHNFLREKTGFGRKRVFSSVNTLSLTGVVRDLTDKINQLWFRELVDTLIFKDWKKTFTLEEHYLKLVLGRIISLFEEKNIADLLKLVGKEPKMPRKRTKKKKKRRISEETETAVKPERESKTKAKSYFPLNRNVSINSKVKEKFMIQQEIKEIMANILEKVEQTTEKERKNSINDENSSENSSENTSDSNKYAQIEDNFAFTTRLSRDIRQFSREIEERNKILAEAKTKATAQIGKKIEDLLGLEHILYGSSATGLDIEASDLDLGVLLEENKYEYRVKAMKSLETAIRGFSWVNNVFCILDAKVPVIKIEGNTEKLLENPSVLSKILPEFPYSETELTEIKIDVSFIRPENKEYPLKSVEWVQKQLQRFPKAKPLIQIMKRILAKTGLNQAFTGGMCSFVLVLLVFAFCETLREDCSEGEILIRMLEWYGKKVNYNCTAIKPGNTRSFEFTYTNTNLLVLEPILGTNAGVNCFRVEQIKEIWAESHSLLAEIACDSKESNSIAFLLHNLIK